MRFYCVRCNLFNIGIHLWTWLFSFLQTASWKFGINPDALKPEFSADPLQIPSAKMSTTPNYEFLSVSTPKEHVFHVELNRPDKLNAINYSLFRWVNWTFELLSYNRHFSELKNCFEFMSESEDCRIVVLSGTGRFFTAGFGFLHSHSFTHMILLHRNWSSRLNPEYGAPNGAGWRRGAQS